MNNEILQFAEETVLGAAQQIALLNSDPQLVRVKEHDDPVTEGDLAVQEFVAQQIAQKYPEHKLLSEEDPGATREAEYLWILDPIDGTMHYARSLPLYAISLALQVRGELTVGVVHLPVTNETYSARIGGGARLNGQAIKVSSQDRLDQALVCVEVPARHHEASVIDGGMTQLRRLLDNSLRVRMVGASAVGLCWTAMGGFDAYVNLRAHTTKIWDRAGGEVVLGEAGAVVTHANDYIIGGPRALHDSLCELLGVTP